MFKNFFVAFSSTHFYLIFTFCFPQNPQCICPVSTLLWFVLKFNDIFNIFNVVFNYFNFWFFFFHYSTKIKTTFPSIYLLIFCDNYAVFSYFPQIHSYYYYYYFYLLSFLFWKWILIRSFYREAKNMKNKENVNCCFLW